MPGSGNQEQYSRKTGFIYIFNLIVGTGALALPAAFAKAGWALGLGIIIVLSFISFMTATFVIESMAIANSILLKARRAKAEGRGSIENVRQMTSRVRDEERDPLIPPELSDRNDEIRRHNTTANTFEIVQRVEMGRMASMFLPKTGLYLFYLCICIYLYGDLAIYITAVATSLRDISCTNPNSNSSTSSTDFDINDDNTNNDTPLDGMCWSESIGITRYDAYRLFAVLFILLLGPFTFFNVQKTKYLQMFTTVMRWAAFLIMITLATIKIAQGNGLGHPPTASVNGVPNLFGVCVYSFMCHHSLPSLITPINSKKGIFRLFFFDYFLITGFYLLLALTGIFAFDNIKDLYTLNFEPDKDEVHVGFMKLMVQYFLSLFPVFTLSTSFPIIAITLRNNLKTLFNLRDDEDEDIDEPAESADEYNESTGEFNSTTSSGRDQRLRSSSSTCCLKLCSLIGFPLLAIAPPFTIALFVENVQLLVSVTGSYAGAGIQYIVPIVLVYKARNRLTPDTMTLNPYSSPFGNRIWIWMVIIWSIICIVFVTANYILHPETLSSSLVSETLML